MSDEKTKHPAVSTYMETPSGRALGVDLGGVKVLVQPQAKADQAQAEVIANWIADTETFSASMRVALLSAEAEIANLKEKLRDANNAIHEKNTIIDSTLTGRRRFFSAVLMKAATPGDWKGEVWLMDPEKQEKGSALRFSSLREVHALHPELWVVARTNDGILLDAWGRS